MHGPIGNWIHCPMSNAVGLACAPAGLRAMSATNDSTTILGKTMVVACLSSCAPMTFLRVRRERAILFGQPCADQQRERRHAGRRRDVRIEFTAGVPVMRVCFGNGILHLPARKAHRRRYSADRTDRCRRRDVVHHRDAAACECLDGIIQTCSVVRLRCIRARRKRRTQEHQQQERADEAAESHLSNYRTD